MPNKSHRGFALALIPALLLAIGVVTSPAALVLDDPLQGSTLGTQSGGAFVTDGWQVTGQTDTIYWHVPTITNGAAEFDVRGLYPDECRSGMADKVELFHMYDYTFNNADINYAPGYRDDPFKHFIRKTDCLDTGRVNSMEVVWQISPNFTEPDTAQLSWDPNTTYHFREEWGPDGAGNAVLKVYRDGALLLTTSVPGTWNPVGHSVRIAASPRRAADFGAPIDAVFGNVKVWNLSSGAPGAPTVTQPTNDATVHSTVVFIQWSGDPHTLYEVRINRANDPDSAIEWDSGEVSSDRNFAWTGSLQDQSTYFVFVRLSDSSSWGPWSGNGRVFHVDTTAVPDGANLVQVNGKSLRDNNGPFLGLGASYFQALRRAKYDRTRLNSDLALLASKGFNYVRILSMVNWDGLEIAPVSFTNSAGHFVAGWPDYWQQFRDVLDLVSGNGLRAEVTVFADAQYVMPSKTARQAHLDGILANITGREHKIAHLEVANEAWQNGFPGSQGVSDLREFAQYLADHTTVPVAITSNDDTSNSGIASLYSGSAADLATVHFSRDTGTIEGGWLPVRDCYRAGNLSGVPPVTSNEPIGAGSSVSTETDPIKLCAAAVFAYIANLPAYVYHSRAGVFGYVNCCPPSGGEVRFEDTAGINAYQFLRQILPPDLASWVRNDGLESSAPFTVFCNGQANKYWPDVSSPSSGCDRNIGSAKGKEFVCFPMGILGGGVTLQARRPVSFQVLNPLTGAVVYNYALGTGSQVTLPQGPGAYLLKGTFLDVDNPCHPWTQFLDGSSLPASPWQPYQGGVGGGTLIVNFLDPDSGATNQALRINSGSGVNEWFVGAFPTDEWAVGARFRLAAYSPAGREDLLCLTTYSTSMSPGPAPAITLVDGRYKLWNYVSANTEIMDLGAVDAKFHTVYIGARKDGKVMLWWDGKLAFDGMAPLVNPFSGYVEWGSGSWQYDATTTVDFDWIVYGDICNLPQLLKVKLTGNNLVLSWPTNALGFALQSTTSLSSPNWTNVTNTVGVVNSNNMVTNGLTGFSRYFRLQR
ncbi:MAG: hypothetical protein HY298_08145 [Verrucomicrobia bacterium]|nr:hypothetical protein [Verrucomicrobiota bacterium]